MLEFSAKMKKLIFSYSYRCIFREILTYFIIILYFIIIYINNESKLMNINYIIL